MRKSWSLGFGLVAVLAAVAVVISQGPLSETGNAERTLLAPTPDRTHSISSAPDALADGSVAFVPNQGQWDHPARYLARIGAGTVFVEKDGWVLALEEAAERPRPEPAWKPSPWEEEPPCPRRGVALRLRFEDASPVAPMPEHRLGGVHHYFLGNDPARWRTDVPRFGAVRLSGLYPGIDACLREHESHLEYDLLLAPGADLEQVVVHLEGADRLTIDADGTREPLDCDYVLLGPGRFGFVAPGWAGDLTLVVDPGLIWSTLVGGNASDGVRGVHVDATGVVTITGGTVSANYPATPGAWDTTHNGGQDAFVARLDPSRPPAQQLLYSTYIGGAERMRPERWRSRVKGPSSSRGRRLRPSSPRPPVPSTPPTTAGTGTSSSPTSTSALPSASPSPAAPVLRSPLTTVT